MNSRWTWALIFSTVFLCASAKGRVVINEIFYHSPNDVEDLEYVELYNTADQPVDLSGWKFVKGIKFQFPPGTKIDPLGYLVVCHNRERLREIFGVEATGTFDQSLKNSGERVELVTAAGERADQVKYSKKTPWPSSPDGHGASLERISPSAPSNLPQNWAASALPVNDRKPTGTPGKQNLRHSENLPPNISGVKFRSGQSAESQSAKGPATAERARSAKSTSSEEASSNVRIAPDEAIAVEARVEDSDGVREVKLRYRLAGPGF